MKRARPTEGHCPWYSIKDMVTLFDVGDRTIWKWVAAGKLPEPVRRGPKWSRWPRAAIDALLREMTGVPLAPAPAPADGPTIAHNEAQVAGDVRRAR